MFYIPGLKKTLSPHHPSIEEIGRLYRPHLGINATPTAFAASLEGLQPPAELPWRDSTRTAHADVPGLVGDARRSDAGSGEPRPRFGSGCASSCPPDAVVCTGAGNFSIWVQRFYRYRKYGTLYAPASGSMGYGLPSAVCDEAAHAGAHRGSVLRRRRLHDDRAGIRHRLPVQAGR